jgi:hypothetical protein
MIITRIDVEKIMIRRAGKRMTAAGLDGTTITGSNADLVDPIVTALRQCDVEPASISAVTDADLALLDDDMLDAFLDLCELRLLNNILGNYTLVDSQTGPRSDNYSQFTTALEKAIEKLDEKCQKVHGIGSASLETGVINLNFQQKGQDYVAD